MAKRESGRLMLESEIPAFVDAVIGAGCDICAIGHDSYVLGDLEEMDAAADELDRIGENSAIAISCSWRLSPTCVRSADISIQARRRNTGEKMRNSTEIAVQQLAPRT
ncbi:hypothetical protein [Sinorhizobium meliloti]|uniref:hypothetical protein n=1 Tax=Rhizobium meliloti TaxID=382 RepID=UPI00299D8EFC